MPFFDYRIAAGWNVALNSLTNIESIKPTNDRYFKAPQAYGLYKAGSRKVRGDGLLFFSGYESVVWSFDALTRAQFEYLRDTINAGAYSGKVTIYTRLGSSTYTRKNAIMLLPDPYDTDGRYFGYKAIEVRMTRLATAS